MTSTPHQSPSKRPQSQPHGSGGRFEWGGTLTRNKKKLHWVAAGKHSDWDGIPKNKQTLLQKIASSTHGFITIGNAISIFGLYLVILGLYNFTDGLIAVGVLQVTAGRALDYFDGILADMTKTKSFVGSTVDVAVDTLELVLSLAVLLDTKSMPLVLIVAISIPKLLSVIGYSTAKLRGKRLNTTGEAKMSTFLISVAIIIFMLHALFIDQTYVRLDVIGWAITIVAVALAVPSTTQYLRVGFTKATQTE